MADEARSAEDEEGGSDTACYQASTAVEEVSVRRNCKISIRQLQRGGHDKRGEIRRKSSGFGTAVSVVEPH